MANALIAMESDLYRAAGAADGDVWHAMTIVERRNETPDVVSFTLSRTDGTEVADFQPGQYVSVQVALPDGAHQIRQYSLSRAPGNPQWRITVKRVHDGNGPDGEVSHRLHTSAAVGDVLTVSDPFGDLVLPADDGPLLLVSAGIGVTPMLAMLEELARTGTGRQIAVLHADRAPSCHAHRTEQERWVSALPNAQLTCWYEDAEATPQREGSMDLSDVALPEGLTVYMCGPLPFMRQARADLLRRGLPAERLHYEVFGPDLWLGQD